jgi:hypothetical protein
MRTATQTTKLALTSRAKLPKKAKRPVTVAAPLASKEATRTIGETQAPKGGIVLKQICAEVGINPKVARRELRKVRKSAIESKEQNALKRHDLHTRWVFAKSDPQVAEIRKVLADYVARNGESEAPATDGAKAPKGKKASKKK